MKKRVVLAGAAFGLLAPLVGFLVGLQISVFLGSLLVLPIIGFSLLIDTPFGMFNGVERLIALAASIVFWTLVFVAVAKAWQYVTEK